MDTRDADGTAVVDLPEGRCVQMLVHRDLDETSRALLVGALGDDVTVTVTERQRYCWLVTARWPDDVVATTPPSRVRAAFRSVLRTLSR